MSPNTCWRAVSNRRFFKADVGANCGASSLILSKTLLYNTPVLRDIRERSCVKLPCVLGLAHCVIDRSFIVRPYKYGLPLSVLAFSIPVIWSVNVRSLIVRSLVFSAPVCITFMHPSQMVKLSAIFLQSFVPKQFFDFRAKFYKDRLRGTHPSGVLNARRVAK